MDLTEEELDFLYGVNEIKAYAYDIIRFTVPYAYLKKFLTKKGSTIIYEPGFDIRKSVE